MEYTVLYDALSDRENESQCGELNVIGVLLVLNYFDSFSISVNASQRTLAKDKIVLEVS